LKIRTIQRVLPNLSLDLKVAQYQRLEASPEMRLAAEELEQRFSVVFGTLTHMSKAALTDLHRAPEAGPDLPETVAVASRDDPSVLLDIEVLTKIANSPTFSLADRQRYYDSLKAIYAKLPYRPGSDREDPNVLFVGIEREGRILAESLNCLPEGHSIHPDAKRIWFNDGLLVGFAGIPSLPSFGRCVVIDGAIASGSTLIALMEHLQATVRSFQICSAHATSEGLRAITRYANVTGIELKVAVGHVTRGINDHYYATVPEDPSRVVVGDLGDMISELGQR
jgi:hypothetical protein